MAAGASSDIGTHALTFTGQWLADQYSVYALGHVYVDAAWYAATAECLFPLTERHGFVGKDRPPFVSTPISS